MYSLCDPPEPRSVSTGGNTLFLDGMSAASFARRAHSGGEHEAVIEFFRAEREGILSHPNLES